MLDFFMRDIDGQDVPIPLPGRGMLFLAVDGLIRCRLHSGEVVELTAGPQGLAGAAGAAGAQGPQGLAGAAGADGAQGPQGLAGAAGEVGAQGPQGLAGAVGEVGAQGPQGAPGAVLAVVGAVSAVASWSTAANKLLEWNYTPIWGGGEYEFEISGLYTKTTTAANIVASISVPGAALPIVVNTLALGTTARTGAVWTLRGVIRVGPWGALVQTSWECDFVTVNAVLGADIAARLVGGSELVAVSVNSSSTTCVLKLAKGRALKVN